MAALPEITADPELLAWFERTRSSHLDALDHAEQTHDFASAVEIGLRLQELLFVRGDGQLALNVGTRAMTAARSLGDLDMVVATELALGRTYSIVEPRAAATKPLLETAIARARQLGSPGAVALGLERLGVVHRDRDDWADAERVLREAIAILPRGHERRRTSCLDELGLTLALQGRYRDATAMHEQALASARAASDYPGTIRALNHLGAALRFQGEVEPAEQRLDEALEMSRALPAAELEAESLHNLAMVYQSQARWDDAAACLADGIALRHKLGDLDGAARALNGLGIVRRKQGQYVAAVTCYEQSLDLRRQLGDRYGESVVLTNLGAVRRNVGPWPQARQCLDDALTLKKELGDRPGLINVVRNLGILATWRGDLEEAEQYLREAVRMAEGPGELRDEPQLVEALDELGEAVLARGAPAEALELHERASRARHRLDDERSHLFSHNGRGFALRQLSRLDEAECAHTEALKLADEYDFPEGRHDALRGLARVHADRGDVVGAVAQLHASAAGAARIGDSYAEVRALSELVAITRDHDGREAARLREIRGQLEPS